MKRKSRMEELMELKEAADERKARREAEIDAQADKKVDDVMSHIKTISRACVLTALDEIDASDDPKATIAKIRKRLSS